MNSNTPEAQTYGNSHLTQIGDTKGLFQPLNRLIKID
uniref:Uncharacterized protein n=1 Tax=Rhizophora mucronata TaxID=61149 RepID=A0A2P2PH31_RHIMU